MSTSSLNYKSKGSYVHRMVAISAIIAVITVLSFVVSYLVSSAVGYVNQPESQVYTSKFGGFSLVYPTGVVLEKSTYDDFIDTATFRGSYNTVDGLDSNKGEGLLMFTTVKNVTPDSYKSIDEEEKFEIDSFKSVYFYEDPSEPGSLQQAEKYAKITRKEYTKTISGHTAKVFDIVEQDNIPSDTNSGYKRHVFIAIKASNTLYIVDAQARENTPVLDAMLDSIKIGATNE